MLDVDADVNRVLSAEGVPDPTHIQWVAGLQPVLVVVVPSTTQAVDCLHHHFPAILCAMVSYCESIEMRRLLQ